MSPGFGKYTADGNNDFKAVQEDIKQAPQMTTANQS